MSTKTKVLFVYGDYEYGALNFEEFLGDKELQSFLDENNLKKNGDKLVDEEHGFIVKLLIFDGEISKNFENFIKNEICDYDGLKHTSFFIVR